MVRPKNLEDWQREAEDGKGSRNRKKLGPHRYLVMHRLIDCAGLDRGWRALDPCRSKIEDETWDSTLETSLSRVGRRVWK